MSDSDMNDILNVSYELEGRLHEHYIEQINEAFQEKSEDPSEECTKMFLEVSEDHLDEQSFEEFMEQLWHDERAFEGFMKGIGLLIERHRDDHLWPLHADTALDPEGMDAETQVGSIPEEKFEEIVYLDDPDEVDDFFEEFVEDPRPSREGE